METKEESIATQDQTRTETLNSPVGGNLAHHLAAWNPITDSSWVLQCIQGYGLEFSQSPPRDNWPPLCPYLSKEQEMVLDQEIKDLLSKRAVELAPSKRGIFSPMFIVPKKDRGWQPIINLKRLNSYLEVPHFKMEGIRDLKDILQMGDYMRKIDLKDAYLTVSVKESHRDFLKFQWKDKNYRFCSLRFGLATAPRVFIKILRPLAAKLRKQGIRILFYLDDLLVLAQSQQMLDQHVYIQYV